MFASLEGYAHQLVEFVRVHEAWAAPVVFALAFGESLAFISLLIPAWAALVGIGVLIGSGDLNFWPVWVAGSLGAAFGDWLSYWIGHKLGPPVAHMWPLSRHPNLLPKGETLGCAGHLHRPLLRTLARVGPAGRRNFPDAVSAVPARQLHLGFRMGRRAAHHGRWSCENLSMDLAIVRDPEKWAPVFGNDHARTKSWSGTMRGAR
jgi:hypothetical protein